MASDVPAGRGPAHGSSASEDFVRRLQQELEEGRTDLKERVKELNCLFTVQRALRRPDREWDEALGRVAGALPPGFRYPGLMGARVTVGGRSFEAAADADRDAGPDPPDTSWPGGQGPLDAGGHPGQAGADATAGAPLPSPPDPALTLSHPIMVGGREAGRVEVFFRDRPPDDAGDPFLREEGDLLEAVADRLAEAVRRRRAEAELRRAESYQRALISASPLAIFSLDDGGRVLSWNRAAERMFGWSADEVVGEPLPTVPEGRDDEFAFLRSRVTAGESFSGMHLVRRRRDGTPIHLRVSAAPVLDDAGEVAAIMAAAEDITEQQEAWERVRFQSDLLEAVGQAVVATDLDGRIMYWNRAAETLYGCPAGRALGRDLADLVPSEARLREEPRVMGILETGRSWTGEFALPGHEGSDARGLVTESPLLDDDGRLVGIVGVASDITELKELEGRFRHSQKMEAVGRLAGGVAHDFNNLLTVIQGHCHLLLEDLPGDTGLRPEVEAMMEEVHRATRLTRQLLSLSRRQHVTAQVLDVSGVLDEMRTMLRRLIPSRIDLGVQIPAEPVPVRMDPSGLEQVVLNLAVNAADAVAAQGSIAFRLDRKELGPDAPVLRQAELEPGRYAHLVVEDDGHGIPGEIVERIFEPFFSTKSEDEGTGLGLSTVFGIVEQAGGAVVVESEPGAGTAFHVYLPLVGEEGEAQDAGSDGATDDGVSANAGNHADGAPGARAGSGGDADPATAADADLVTEPCPTRTVLVVDDAGAVREVARRTLERAGFRVLVANHGHEALELTLANRDAVDLVVSDVVMPGIGGGDLLERLRELRPDLRIVLISGHSEREIPEHIRRRASVFLSKPFGPDELLKVVRETMNR